MVAKAEVAKLYVATFNRAPDADGLDYWADSNFTIEQIAKSFFDQSETQLLYPEGTTNEAFVTAIYNNLFDRAPEADGLAYWVDALDAGTVSRSNMILAVANGAQDTDDTILDNKTEVGLYYAAEGGEGTDYSLEDVDATDASVDAAKAEIDSMFADAETYTLTSGTDRFEGTAGADEFDAPIVQNQWAGGVSNSLSTADRLDGGGGNDTLHAELVPEFFGVTGDNQMDVQPRIESIEDIEFEALDVQGLVNAAPNSAITVDAKNIEDVVKIGSSFSDGDLKIENLTTLTSDGVARNTDAITITMDHTDDFDSDGDASDLTVLFDEDYLLNDADTSGAQLRIDLVNVVTNDPDQSPANDSDNHNPLSGFTQIRFKVGEDIVDLDIASVADMKIEIPANSAEIAAFKETVYKELVDFINDKFEGNDPDFNNDHPNINFDNLTAELLDPVEAIYSINIGNAGQGSSAGFYWPIVIKNEGPEELDGVTVTKADLTYETELNSDFIEGQPQTTLNPVSVNVELEKVGRDGEGGDLVIGGKDLDLNGDSDVDQRDGIQKFDITVLGGEDKPSNLGTIESTNNALRTVVIDSAEPEKDSAGNDTWADLTVRTDLGMGQELTLIDSTSFMGDFSLGVSGAQQALTSNFGIGNDTYNWMSVENATNDDDGKEYSISMGGGNDTVTALLDGDSVDALGESFNLMTGDGNDTVTVDMVAGVSYNTMHEISSNQDTYLDINTGAGNDRVKLNDYGTFDIVTESGDDYIEIDADSATEGGAWAIFPNTGADVFERVLYKAQLTVSFAGFEKTIDIETTAANNFVATQAFMASEIQRAIESDDTLSEFLTVNIAAGTNQVTITSDIDGANVLGISLYQPELISAGTATAAQAFIDSNDVSALRQGLLATETVANLSEDLENAAEISTWVGANTWEGQVDQAGVGNNSVGYSAAQLTNDTAEAVQDDDADVLDDATFLNYNTGGSANDTTVVNFSTINAGAGDDIIVLDSNVGSMNTIVVDAPFGYDRVVNFFNDTTDITDNAAAEVGNHIIDYSAFLTDRVDTSDASAGNSNNNDSATLADTNVILATAARSFSGTAHGAAPGTTIDANDVAVIRFDSSAANNTSETFASLSAADVRNALNGDYDTTGDNAYGNLADAIMSAAAVTDYVSTTQNHIIMIENDLNEGEYKVFHATSTIDANTNSVIDGDFATVTELGTFDFGASVNLAISQEESVMAALEAAIDLADNVEPGNTAPVVDAQAFSVDENSAAGTIVGSVAASDVDGDALTYSLADSSVFEIDPATGELTVAAGAVLDFETTASYDLNVTVDDGTATDTAVVTVALNDVEPEGPVVDVIDIVEGTTADVAATAEAEVFSFDAGAAFALTDNTQIQITGFDTAADELQLDITTAGGEMTLDALNGVDGIAVQSNAITNKITINFGADADGDVVALQLVGITDATQVQIETAF